MKPVDGCDEACGPWVVLPGPPEEQLEFQSPLSSEFAASHSLAEQQQVRLFMPEFKFKMIAKICVLYKGRWG